MATQYTAGLTTGQVLTAATMNSIGAAWETYTPTWASSGTQPAIGNGTRSGRYCRIQKLVVAQIYFAFNTTTTFGTGNYGFGLPFTPATTGKVLGLFGGYDASAGFVWYGFNVWNASGAEFNLYTITTGGIVGATAPITWASGDILSGTITYEAA